VDRRGWHGTGAVTLPRSNSRLSARNRCCNMTLLQSWRCYGQRGGGAPASAPRPALTGTLGFRGTQGGKGPQGAHDDLWEKVSVSRKTSTVKKDRPCVQPASGCRQNSNVRREGSRQIPPNVIIQSIGINVSITPPSRKLTILKLLDLSLYCLENASRQDLLTESRKHIVAKLLGQIPQQLC
jgi:hypothetical protein